MSSKKPRIGKVATRAEGGLEEQRCPRCDALLFRADAEGQVEIKCRKCAYMIKRTLTHVSGNRSLTWSPAEGQGQFKSPERPLTEARGNELGR